LIIRTLTFILSHRERKKKKYPVSGAPKKRIYSLSLWERARVREEYGLEI
jgi:hypothetical protein